MKELVDTAEMYLRTILELEEEGITPLRARIVERLEQSGPTVSQTVSRMERDGLVKVHPDRRLELTEEGRAKATAVMRKHRIAERLLTDIIGLDISKVHDEACRWEHVMSDDVEARILEVLDEVTTSPFGNPIPGLDRLPGEKTATPTIGVPVSTLPKNTPIETKIVQLHEMIQLDQPFFSELCKSHIQPGVAVTVTNTDTGTIIKTHSTELILPSDIARAIRVKDPAEK